MKSKKQYRWGAALGAGLFTSFSLLPSAHAELVLESQLQNSAPAQPQQTVQVINRTQAPVAAVQPQQQVYTQAPVQPVQVVQQQPVYQQQTYQPAVQTAPAYVTQPVYVAPAAPTVSPYQVLQDGQSPYVPAAEQQAMPLGGFKHKRMQVESQNEDALQRRLEQLRLQDEERRLDSIFGRAQQPSQQAGVAAPLEEVNVGAPTAAGAAPVATPVAAPAAGGAMVMAPTADGGASIATTAAPSNKDAFTFGLRVGTGKMANTDLFEVNGRSSIGVQGGWVVSPNFTLTGGYSYNQYSVNLLSSNPYIQQIQYYDQLRGGDFSLYNMNQNILEAGAKMHLLDEESRVRPFIQGGGAYSFSYVNFTEKYDQYLQNSGLNADYKSSASLFYLGGGFDIRLAKRVSLGLDGRYYKVVSSKENNNLNVYPGYNGGYGSTYGQAYDGDKQVVGGSLARSDFWTATGAVNFQF